MGLDFNHDALVSGNNFYNALGIWQNGSPQTFSLAPFENRTFYFKILYQPSGIAQPTNLQAQVQARLTYGSSGLVTRIYTPKVFKTVAGTINDHIGDFQTPAFVNGPVTLTGNPNPNTSIIAPLVLVSSGGSIKINNDTYVTIGGAVPGIATSIEGCTTMWKGFTMGSGSSITMDNATIKDAQKAIEARPGTVLRVTNSRFHNNNYGIFTETDQATGYNLTLTAAMNMAPYPAVCGRPAPTNRRYLMGIKVLRASMPTGPRSI